MEVLTIDGIKDAGGFASNDLKKVDIEYVIDEVEYKASVFVRDMRYSESRNSKDEIDMLVKFIRLGEDGKEMLTRELVSQMKPPLVNALSRAVTGAGKKKS